MEFAFPPQYSLPPFFTLQPVEETRRKQTQIWCAFILSYCKAHGIAELEIQAALETPLCRNAAIQRGLNAAALRAFVDALVLTNNAAWLDDEHRVCRIMVDTPEAVGANIYAWATRTGNIDQVCTVYDLYAGDDTEGESFHGLDSTLVMRALEALEAQGKARIFHSSSGSAGVKFFDR